MVGGPFDRVPILLEGFRWWFFLDRSSDAVGLLPILFSWNGGQLNRLSIVPGLGSRRQSVQSGRLPDCQTGICQSGTNLAAARLVNLGFAAVGANQGNNRCWDSCVVLLKSPDWVKRQIARLFFLQIGQIVIISRLTRLCEFPDRFENLVRQIGYFPDWPDCNYSQMDQIV